MADHILAVNAGSSSLKCTLFKASKSADPQRLASAEASGLNGDEVTLEFNLNGKEESSTNKDISSHGDAFKAVLKRLNQDVLSSDAKLTIAHRVVHGGDFKIEAVITEETLHRLEEWESLAPLHNAPALAIIRTCLQDFKDSKNVAFFDTSFHSTMSQAVITYAIDPNAKSKGLRKYGFHGISYKSILRRMAQSLGKPQSETNLIALHLGSGASVCAIKNGKSVDTSMGLTPVSGLPGSSRSGDIDPSLVFHYTSDASKLSQQSTKELHITTAEDILNKKSGWKAMTGTADFSKIGIPSAEGQHRLAFDVFVDRIVNFVGSYYVKLDGKVDALVFAGGIGERSAYLRSEVVKRCSCLGFTIDESKNEMKSDSVAWEIGESSSSKVYVCHTDEEGEMARTLLTNHDS